MVGWDWEDLFVESEAVGVREERRVSWMPGADGAPPAVELVLLVDVAWLEGGAMWRD